MFKNVKFSSTIEDASVLRKFTVLFLLMSIIPIGILYVLYLQVKELGSIVISAENFRITLVVAVIGVAVGYWAMRSVLKQLIDLAKANKNALEAVLGPKKIRELSEEKNEIAILAKSFSEVTSRLEENIQNLEVAKRTLHSVLARVGEGISSMQNIDAFLDLIVETASEAFVSHVGVLMLKDKRKENLYAKAIFGCEASTNGDLRVSVKQEPFASVLESHTPVIVDHIDETQRKEIGSPHVFRSPMLCAPLVLHERVIGIIAVCGKKDETTFKDDEKHLLHNLALQTAVAVENSTLNEDAEKTYFETISALALAVDAKDKYSRGHLDRVADYVVRIAKKLKLSDDQIKVLRNAARLHDVGKIGIPDEVLMKPAPLTTEEMDLMKKHTEIGESIIRPIHSLRELGGIIRHHHEKLDGSGYPDGLRGDQIPLLVRITTVADIYDALTTDRPYRKKFSAAKATAILRDMNGQIDQEIVELFLETLQN